MAKKTATTANSQEDNKQSKKSSRPSKKMVDFVDIQLTSSGLTFDDVIVKCPKDDENHTIFEKPAFSRGSIDQYGRLTNGDDMIISYYDLNGQIETYRDSKGRDLPFFRVRWANTDAHTDKNGKPMKYKSPVGSGSHVYIPQKVRTLYEYTRNFDRLYIAEGEKKAEKMCKHGLFAIGIPGITALADKNKRLPQCVELLVKRCSVKEVCFMLDGDLFDLSGSIEPDKDILQRPRSFYYAVKNYKEYFRTFYNLGINIQIYFGYVQPTTNQKGIDDLLVKNLSGSEHLLIEEIKQLANEKDMNGIYVKMHRISTMTDQQLEAIWGYNDAEKFAVKHKEKLESLPYFTMWKHKWRFNEDGIFESAQPLENDEMYWEVQYVESKSGNSTPRYNFHYGRCFNFLKNRGFGRYKQFNGDCSLARIDGRIVSLQDAWEVRDFVIDFTKAIKQEAVLELLYRGGVQYLGPDRLSNLEFINPEIEKSSKNRQIFYFSNKIWEITSKGVKERSLTEIEGYIWNDWIKRFDAKLFKEPLFQFTFIDDELLSTLPASSRQYFSQFKGHYMFDKSEEGKKCHFLSFLENTANFTWRKGEDEVTAEELIENIEHLLARLTALGFLLHSYKDPGVCKAVIAMDGKLSEVGSSNGRSGKSLFGNAVAQIVNQVYIGGKSKNLTEDSFLYNDVTDKTRNLFLDDVRSNIDFEHFFPLITGNLSVNVKSGGRFIIPFENTPKLLITTNHAINGDGSSFADRQWIIAFSDFYNDTHKPTDDFGLKLFYDWGYDQWNLFYNMCANAVSLYLKYGVVQSPNDNVEKRKLRQIMGEEFILWADEYFSEDANINMKIPRKEMYDNFISMFPMQAKFTPQTSFKKKIKAYCDYYGYVFNKNMYDDKLQPLSFDKKTGTPIIDDKSGGVEYFTIGNEKFEWTDKRYK